jgi:hypothetical protein
MPHKNLDWNSYYSFLCSPNYKVFRVEILHVGRVHHYKHLGIFFQIILKLQNVIYNFFKKQATCSPIYTCSFR